MDLGLFYEQGKLLLILESLFSVFKRIMTKYKKLN